MDDRKAGGGPQEPGKPWERRLNEAGARMEEELRRVVRYVDEEVVPEVRRNSSKALRIASEQLRRLAEQMEERNASSCSPGFLYGHWHCAGRQSAAAQRLPPPAAGVLRSATPFHSFPAIAS